MYSTFYRVAKWFVLAFLMVVVPLVLLATGGPERARDVLAIIFHSAFSRPWALIPALWNAWAHDWGPLVWYLTKLELPVLSFLVGLIHYLIGHLVIGFSSRMLHPRWPPGRSASEMLAAHQHKPSPVYYYTGWIGGCFVYYAAAIWATSIIALLFSLLPR